VIAPSVSRLSRRPALGAFAFLPDREPPIEGVLTMAAAEVDLSYLYPSLRASVDVRVLRDAVRVAAFVAPTKSSARALTHLRIESDAGDIVVSATNLDADVRLRIAAHLADDGSVLVDAKDLTRVLARAKGDAQIECVGASLVTATSTGRHSLPTLPATDFPPLPQTSSPAIATLRGEDLARMIRAVSYAQSIDASREHLFGTLIERADGVLRMCATDGHRLALSTTRNPGPDFRVLVHRAAIDAMARTDIEEESEVLLRLDGSRIFFETPSILVSGKIIDATFPRYESVIPIVSREGSITFARRQLLSALDAVSTRHREGVCLDVDTERSVVRLTTSDGDHEASIEVEAVLSGNPPPRIGFDAHCLRQPLAVISDDHVSVGFGDALDPIRIDSSDGSIAVVMPMRV
jgi:DNA polymerase-3 subunit beta